MSTWPYNTRTWQQLRLRKLREQPLCEYCPPTQRRPATEVDHRLAISDGGAVFDMVNLASACKRCHSQKTSRGEQLHGCDENGLPRDPRHFWNR